MQLVQIAMVKSASFIIPMIGKQDSINNQDKLTDLSMNGLAMSGYLLCQVTDKSLNIHL